MDFKFYNLHITQESKTAWEQGEIKNPRFSLKGTDRQDLTIDEAESLLIESIRDSFAELREVIDVSEFSEAKIIMPSLQMVSDSKLDVVDFGIVVINPTPDEDEVDSEDEEYVEEETLSDWNHPSEMWEEFAEMMADDESEEEKIEESEEEIEEPSKVSENEMDIIKKRLSGL